MNEEQELEQATIVTPGQLLKQAREAMQLSTAQVALRLNLREHIIDDIEADIYDGKISLTFTKGYLKTYAKLVKVPEVEVLDAFEQVNRASKEPAKLQSFSRRVARQASDDRLMLVTYAIVIILVALSVMWWFQQSDDVAPAKLNATSSNVTTKAEEKTAEDSGSATQPQAIEQQQTLSEQDPQTEADSVAELQDSDQPVADNTTADTQVPSEDNSGIEETDVASVVEQNEQNIVADDSVEQAEEQPRVQHFTATEAHDFADPVQLVFEFSQDCWINIVDATGEAIAYGIKVQGRVMPVSGIPPFEVTVGIPEAVKISYAGEEVDLSRFPKNRTARFNLPLED
ncbi:cytoskeleton protein RodZ [Neptunicella marina]|uniref:Cytoskeleton protein RodZ n=1 Tax=Neptunicella marina TaxID=2125989 RepID=A0A8J6IU13_9ALTE|nr:cytoskeleton protein RodZ [Neptunicella marina]MBC3766234.1 cytoskeleton protein RodZ [Neptunicella marina]